MSRYDQHDYSRLSIPAPLSEQEQDILDQLIATLADLPEERCPVHRLFGYQSHVQLESVAETVRTLAAPEVDASAAEWRLLLHVDSDYDGPDFGWADGGIVWFFIRATDLSLGHFDRTWLYWECG